VYGQARIRTMLDVFNTFVRVADDYGDRDIDRVAFSLNLFNQAHPELLRAFFLKARIDSDKDTKELTDAFIATSADEELAVAESESAQFIVGYFTNHVRKYMSDAGNLPHKAWKYGKYMNLSKRGVEAAEVNRDGYTALASK
jgi:hypothetical protein